jgi:hypothetical protein
VGAGNAYVGALRRVIAMRDLLCRPRVRCVRALVFALVLAVAACGGDSGESMFTASSGGGGGFIARGVITGFGSIFVNGIEITTSGATIRVDGAGAIEADLKVGQVVEVQGTLNSDGLSGTASTITFDDDVEGPIAAVGPDGQTLVVLGQTIRLTSTTVLARGDVPLDLIDLAPGILVEVSGFADSSGAIIATRIERRFTPSQLEVSGRIGGLDIVDRLLSINALIVDYSGATVTGALANGACVEAKGAGSTSGTLAASSVQVKACGVESASNDRGDIEGIITRFASAKDFDVGGQRVTTDSATTFSQGGASDLRLDLKVEVEGTFNSAGTLQASNVDIAPDNSAPDSSPRLTGTVDTFDATAGTLTIFGISVTVNAGTRLEDASSAQMSPLRFSDLRTGDYLEVRGSPGATASSLVATQVTRRDLDLLRNGAVFEAGEAELESP